MMTVAAMARVHTLEMAEVSMAQEDQLICSKVVTTTERGYNLRLQRDLRGMFSI